MDEIVKTIMELAIPSEKKLELLKMMSVFLLDAMTKYGTIDAYRNQLQRCIEKNKDLTRCISQEVSMAIRWLEKGDEKALPDDRHWIESPAQWDAASRLKLTVCGFHPIVSMTADVTNCEFAVHIRKLGSYLASGGVYMYDFLLEIAAAREGETLRIKAQCVNGHEVTRELPIRQA